MSAPPKSTYTVREYGFPADADRPYFLFADDTTLKAHPDYRAAKAGDQAAAVSVVWDIAAEYLARVVAQLSKDVIFVAPFAREATGDNAIPQVIAAACAALTGGKIDNEIVQVTRVFHTGADPMERLNLRAQFEGDVVIGGCYVLIDDVVSMGGTLAELADYIQRAGGKVASVITLVNAGRIKTLQGEPSVIKKLQERYSNEILDIFGVQPTALTANEAQYLVGFRTADEIRNRLAKARKEIHRRLRSKGIRWADEREATGNAS
jgi:orotate phosphoribosyltransferase